MSAMNGPGKALAYLTRGYSLPAPAREQPRIRTHAILFLACPFALGCTPTVNILGVYFPPSLVSTFIGVSSSYVAVRLLARRPSLRPVAQSALFFGSISVVTSYLVWWSLFSGF